MIIFFMLIISYVYNWKSSIYSIENALIPSPSFHFFHYYKLTVKKRSCSQRILLVSEDSIVRTVTCKTHFLFCVYVHYSHNRSFLLLNSSRFRNVFTQVLQHSSATWHFKRLRTMGCIVFYISLLLEWVLLRYTVKNMGNI